MSESKNIEGFSLSDIEFSQLEESRFEEFRLNINLWWTTSDTSVTDFNFVDFPRLTKEDFTTYIADGTVMIIACIKKTNEMVGISGLEPIILRGKQANNIILGAVKPEYRQFGIAKRMIDEAIEIAKRMGIERVMLTTSFYNKYLSNMLNKMNFTLTGTMIQHKSSYIKNWFLATQDYRIYNCWEKII